MLMRRLTILATTALVLTMAPQSASADCQTNQLECLPTAQECADGNANGVWLGEHFGSAAVCAGTGGTVVAYVGGNVTVLCGTVIVADQALFEDDPRACDDLTFFPEVLTYRVQLPSDYASSTRRYPVLYLLPGGGGDENTWFDYANLPALADRGAIIVSPYNGVSFYADWRDGSIAAETLYIRTLIPLIDATYRTIPDRGHRSVAGFSQGGLGALAWSARHPDLFSVAGSFSGVTDLTLNDPFGDASFAAVMKGAAPYRDPLEANRAFGDPITDAVWWHNFNPADMPRNLRSIALWLASGNGIPGVYETGNPANLPFAPYPEAEIYARNASMRRELDAAGIPHRFRTHNGGHLYEYAADELEAWFPWMMARLGAPDPASFDYRTVERTFGVWGWSFAADAGRAPEFLDVTNASTNGLTLTGSGPIVVKTAPYFPPGSTVGLEGATTFSAVADSAGAITFTVNLGPPHTMQQYTPLAIVAEGRGGYFTTKTVRFLL
jgi:S-formylglutathione hydrolase FrmB